MLADFIRDFNLKTAEKEVICFDARIEYRAQGVYRRLESEVQIIFLEKTGLSVVYLLHPDISKYDIPDTFPFDPEQFVYIRNAALIIVGNHPGTGRFSVTIQTLDNSCEVDTVEELKAKNLN